MNLDVLTVLAMNIPSLLLTRTITVLSNSTAATQQQISTLCFLTTTVTTTNLGVVPHSLELLSEAVAADALVKELNSLPLSTKAKVVEFLLH